jgi:hypothetical protein
MTEFEHDESTTNLALLALDCSGWEYNFALKLDDYSRLLVLTRNELHDAPVICIYVHKPSGVVAVTPTHPYPVAHAEFLNGHDRILAVGCRLGHVS